MTEAERLARVENERLGENVFESIAPSGDGWGATLREGGVDGTWYYGDNADEAIQSALEALRLPKEAGP